GLAEHATYVLAYTLLCLGVLQHQPAPAPRSGPPVTGAAAQAGAQRRSGPPITGAAQQEQAEQRALAEVISRIRGKYQQVQSGDYFTLLGLGPSAGAIDVRRAYESLRADLSGDALPPPSRAELATEIAQIALVLDEACALLSDDEVRASYRAHLLP